MDQHKSQQQYDEWLCESEDDGEEFYDALNDETFGNFDEQDQFSWDDLQSIPRSNKTTNESDHYTVTPNVNCTKTTQSEKFFSNEYKVNCLSEDQNYPFDKSLEENILKLVMEDEDDEACKQGRIDDKEEGVAENKQSYFENTTAGSKSGYFIPPQQISAKHSHGLHNKLYDVCGATTSNGSVSWSAHPTASVLTNSLRTQTTQKILKKPRTLIEIEKKLLGQSGTPPSSKPGQNAVLMLEDLERELLKDSVESSSPSAQYRDMPIMGPEYITKRPPISSTLANNGAMRSIEILNHPPPLVAQNWHHGKTLVPVQHEWCQRQQSMMRTAHCFPYTPPNLQKTFSYYTHTPPPPPGYQRPIRTSYDQYEGLVMTENDKQRLRNIQSSQLHSDHPSTTDYYNLMRKAKTVGPGLELHRILVKLYPRADDEETSARQRRQYEPSFFENCLGQLHAVSSLTPKRVMDTFVLLNSGTESCYSPRRSAYQQRHLLLEIEKLYEYLLIMEEFHIRTGILCIAEEEKNVIKRRSNEIAEKVSKILTKSENKLLLILSVPKGKSLLCRVLPFLDATLRYKMLGYLLYKFPVWAGDDNIDKIVFPYLRQCILNAQEMGHLFTLIGATRYNNQEMFEGLAAFKLGVTLIMCIFHQAEHILMTRCDPVLLQDIENMWIRQSMAGISVLIENYQRLPTPMEYFPNIHHHLRRFPFHQTDTEIVKSILHRWGWNINGIL